MSERITRHFDKDIILETKEEEFFYVECTSKPGYKLTAVKIFDDLMENRQLVQLEFKKPEGKGDKENVYV